MRDQVIDYFIKVSFEYPRVRKIEAMRLSADQALDLLEDVPLLLKEAESHMAKAAAENHRSIVRVSQSCMKAVRALKLVRCYSLLNHHVYS